MNPETLIGTELGTVTLQQLLGQGDTTAVYLAQQSRPLRQVAVKVLFLAASLSRDQQATFLELFRSEINAATSLEHPNIVSIYEYGDVAELAYLVMPYIDGGTLRAMLEREGALPLSKVVNHLDQLASALDFAHERGITHCNIKPANMLLSSEGSLLLADFGMAKIVARMRSSASNGGGQERLWVRASPAPDGVPRVARHFAASTLEYIAPEQVLDEEVNERADVYSLGVILYQMVTGTVPFQGVTPMRVAMQHIHTPPPPPRTLRPDLPVVAEQVMLRALAKRPADRYASGQNLAAAFRVALTAAEIPLDEPVDAAPVASSEGSTTGMRLFTPRGLFDPVWQSEATPAINRVDVLDKSAHYDSMTANANGHSSNSVDTLRAEAKTLPTSNQTEDVPFSPQSPPPALPMESTPGQNSSSPLPAPNTTGHLRIPSYDQDGQNGQDSKKTVRLTESVKVVRVPVAGQPGQYVTGLLPMPEKEQPAFAWGPHDTSGGYSRRMKIPGLIAAVLLIFLGTGAFLLVRSHPGTGARLQSTATPNAQATLAAQATASVNAKIILNDPLSQNIHNWIVSTQGSKTYIFENDAYHIANNDGKQVAPAILQFRFPDQVYTYTLTMQEIKGDDTSPNNSFGMILDFNQHSKNGRISTAFYSFEVVNTKGGEYQFWRYDDSRGGSASPWAELWHHSFGHEFHEGRGHANIFSIHVNGEQLTFMVNNKKVGSTRGTSLTGGEVGMLVNLKGTEIAFSNLELTRS